ncbi:MAG: dihydroneopterin aldolase [Clostridia bacterium]|nr:dihydroneopterin aldolase [Clostridia bacterium]
MDKIIINNLKIYAYHGVNPEEKIQGQNFILDIICKLDLKKPCQTDNVDDTVSYAQVIKLVKRVFVAEKYDLIEKAAQVVADSILDAFEQIEKVEITLKKPEAPIKADFSYVAVEIKRER